MRQRSGACTVLVLIATSWSFSFLMPGGVNGFPLPPRALPPKICVTTELKMNKFFDGLGSFFSSGGDNNDGADGERDDDDDDDAMGSSRIISLPVESLKPGGLRLFLMFYLMGEQNTPEKGSWKIDQPTTEEYAVDLYYHDRTAALMIRLEETGLTIDRLGSTPSTSYIMQEAAMVDKILDELQRMVIEGDVAREDRLILLKDENAIVNARQALAFG